MHSDCHDRKSRPSQQAGCWPKWDGRREFDEDAVRELVALCLKPGVSIALAAMDHDVNPNQLRRWIARDQLRISHGSRESDAMAIDGVQIDIPAPTLRSPGTANTLPAFVPVIAAPVSPSTPSTSVPSMALALHVRLPNGVELDFGETSVEEITTIIEVLGRLACSGSTKV